MTSPTPGRIKIGDYQYTIERLDARKQFHIVRRLAPILAALGEVTLKTLSEDKKLTFAMVAGPIAMELSRMSNEDTDYILTACLSVCFRLINGQPAPVQAPRTDQLMFPDIDMPTMMKLTIAVIEENMTDFFDIAQLGSNGVQRV